jgi:hypothetical protein
MLNNLDPVIAQALAPFVLPALDAKQQRLIDFIEGQARSYASNPKFSAELQGYANELREYFQGVRPGSKLSMTAGGYLYSIPKDQLGS